MAKIHLGQNVSLSVNQRFWQSDIKNFLRERLSDRVPAFRVSFLRFLETHVWERFIAQNKLYQWAFSTPGRAFFGFRLGTVDDQRLLAFQSAMKTAKVSYNKGNGILAIKFGDEAAMRRDVVYDDSKDDWTVAWWAWLNGMFTPTFDEYVFRFVRGEGRSGAGHMFSRKELEKIEETTLADASKFLKTFEINSLENVPDFPGFPQGNSLIEDAINENLPFIKETLKTMYLETLSGGRVRRAK